VHRAVYGFSKARSKTNGGRDVNEQNNIIIENLELQSLLRVNSYYIIVYGLMVFGHGLTETSGPV